MITISNTFQYKNCFEVFQNFRPLHLLKKNQTMVYGLEESITQLKQIISELLLKKMIQDQ